MVQEKIDEAFNKMMSTETAKPSRLSQAVQGKVVAPLRVVLYAPVGTGKTTAAAKIPNHIFLLTEDGNGEVEGNFLPLRTKWEEIVSDIEALIVEEHTYKNLIIDSLDWFVRIMCEVVAEEMGVTSFDKIGYGKGPGIAAEKLRKVLRVLDTLRTKKNMNIILLCHCAVTEVKSPLFEPYQRYSLAMNEKISEVVKQWADCIFFAVDKATVKKEDDQKVGKAIGKGKRIMFTADQPAFIAKSRYSLPAQMDFEPETLAKVLSSITK